MIARFESFGAWMIEERFFFQAEEGIRDDLVTGVQTCALPISTSPAAVAALAPALRLQPDWSGSPSAVKLAAALSAPACAAELRDCVRHTAAWPAPAP